MESYKITWEKATYTILRCNNEQHAEVKAKKLENRYGKTIKIEKVEK